MPLKKKDEEQIKTGITEELFFYHIVKKQETLYGISQKYGVSIEKIEELNPDLEEYLKEGQTLKIPVIKKNNSESNIDWQNKSITHTVKYGETLYGIAKEYNVSIGEIRNANPGLSDILKIGEKLLIPNQEQRTEIDTKKPVKQKEPEFIEHKVQAKETLYRIAKNYFLSIDSIKKYNPGLISNDIYIGQVIKIPIIKPETNYIIHTSEKKDKLQKIAKKYDVNYSDIIAINPEIDNKVPKGQTIKIPIEIPDEPEPGTALPDIPVNEELFSPCGGLERNKDYTYNVALMLPLFLEELDSMEINKENNVIDQTNVKSFRFIQFYEGFLMAVDSMKAKGMNLNLFVYDIDNTSEKTHKVLQTSELSSMDLIIGPFYKESFEQVAKFAKAYEIKIINPLSTREEIIFDNPFVFKAKPTTGSQADLLVSLISEQYPEANVIIVRHNNYKYQSTVSFIRNYLNSKRKIQIYIPNRKILEYFASNDTIINLYTENFIVNKDFIAKNPNDSSYFSNTAKEAIYVNDSINGIKTYLSRNRKNFIITLSEDKVFSQEILSRLNKLSGNFDITLFGLPEWDKYNDLETVQLLNLDFHNFSSSYIDFEDRNVKKWIINFRNRFKTEPAVKKFAYDGFDIGWYFMNALFLYGKKFEDCLNHFDISLIQTTFEFEQVNNNGYQNIYWNVGRYKDYKFLKVAKNTIELEGDTFIK
ncbi:MAG: LysM peptidoglycan-binding domain-containing protein [Bacteroidales bacterium]|nr:LysM peptidoglycan-binding domain-containing protein [Bacteroidales bacterium]